MVQQLETAARPTEGLGTAVLEEGGRVDFGRLRSERLARSIQEARREGLDVVVLGDEANARYVSGARRLWLAGTRPFAPGCVLVVASGQLHLMSTWEDGIPAEIPRTHLFGTPWDPSRFVTALNDVEGIHEARRIGIDGMTPMMSSLLSSVVPSAELVDATPAMERARRLKTPDELACIQTAVAVAEACLTSALDQLRPGDTERAVFGRFVRRLGDFGLSIPSVEASICATPRFAGAGGVTVRRIGSDRHLDAGDLVACDVGVFYAGYEGGLARTWPCGSARPGGRHPSGQSLHRRWSALREALVGACRAGNAAGDAIAAYRGTGEALPTIPILYGVGLGMEPPVVGDGVPSDAGATTPLEPGMVVAVQGYLHEEGIGGYLGREMVLVTTEGPRVLTRHSDGSLGEG